MHINRLDLNLLVIFKAIYDRGGVSRAADQLNLSQPAISHALTRLRDVVGDPLFLRNGQKLVPTPTADRLIDPVRKALENIDKAFLDLQDFDPQNANYNFTIGINSLIESAFFEPLVKKIRPMFKNINLSSVRLDRKNMDKALANGQIDLAIDIGLPTGRLIHKKLIISSPLVVIAHKSNTLFQNEERNISFDDYMNSSHIIVSSRPSGQSHEDNSIASFSNLQRNIFARCQQVPTAIEIIKDSNQLLTISQFLTNNIKNFDEYIIFTPPFAAPNTEIYAYWHVNSQFEKPMIWLREILLDVASKI